jgi:IstB-like ATP binding protein
MAAMSGGRLQQETHHGEKGTAWRRNPRDRRPPVWPFVAAASGRAGVRADAARRIQYDTHRVNVLPGVAKASHDHLLKSQISIRRFKQPGPPLRAGQPRMTSNKSFVDWGEVFTDQILATEILDCLLHHAATVVIKGYSYRLREKKKAGLLERKPNRPATLREVGAEE